MIAGIARNDVAVHQWRWTASGAPARPGSIRTMATIRPEHQHQDLGDARHPDVGPEAPVIILRERPGSCLDLRRTCGQRRRCWPGRTSGAAPARSRPWRGPSRSAPPRVREPRCDGPGPALPRRAAPTANDRLRRPPRCNARDRGSRDQHHSGHRRDGAAVVVVAEPLADHAHQERSRDGHHDREDPESDDRLGRARRGCGLELLVDEAGGAHPGVTARSRRGRCSGRHRRPVRDRSSRARRECRRSARSRCPGSGHPRWPIPSGRSRRTSRRSCTGPTTLSVPLDALASASTMAVSRNAAST